MDKTDGVWFVTPEEDYQMIINSEKYESYNEGVNQGIRQGIEQAKKENAINLIKKGIDLDTISECVGLSLNEVILLEKDS